MQSLTVKISQSTRDRLAAGLMLISAVGALGAFIGSISTVGVAGPDTQQVETWRMLGFIMFTGVFLLLAFGPRRYPGLWELVIANKAALTVAEIVLVQNNATGAGSAAAVDGILTMLVIAAYSLSRGYESIPRDGFTSNRSVTRSTGQD